MLACLALSALRPDAHAQTAQLTAHFELSNAAERGDVAAIKRLLAAGTRPMARDGQGCTARLD
jgi:hypothetical protein